MSDSPKGKGREAGLGRQGLLWSDVYEHLGLAGQTRPLAISSQNAVVFSPSAPTQRSQQEPLSAIGSPSISLQCYPIDNTDPLATTAASSRRTFAVPLPVFALPHLPATHLSFSPTSDHFLAFFPLAPSPSAAASCSSWTWAQPAAGEGGTLVLWTLTGSKGRSVADWKLQESWACAQGDEVVDVAWLGGPRQWKVSASAGAESEAEGAREPTLAPTTFTRRGRCGPPLLPSQHPTFLVLAASHSITLYHPPSPTAQPASALGGRSQQPVLLRTTRCTVDGPGTATWGVMSDASSAPSDDARKRQRRVRRGRFHTRPEDDAIYLALHSTVDPPPPPASSSGAAGVRNGSSVSLQPAATGTAEILAGLGIDVDLPNLTAETPLPDPSAMDAAGGAGTALGIPSPAEDDEPVALYGDEDFVEVVEISVDFLVDDHLTLSSRPYPAIPLSSSSELSSSAIVTDIVFAEAALSDPMPSPDARARSLSLVVFVVDLAPGAAEDQPSRPVSELHQWRIDKDAGELSKAFAELETARAAVPETAEGAGNETAMFVQSRVLPALVLTALEPLPGAQSLVVALEVSNEGQTDGNVGSFRVLDLATFEDSSASTSVPLRSDPRQGHHVPTLFASTPNAAFLAIFDTRSSSVNFHLHPHFADVKVVTDDAQIAQRIGGAIALALHQGSDVQDIIKTLPLRAAAGQGKSGNKRKRGAELEIIEAVVAACWQTLDGSSSPETSSVGKSRWILRLVQLQHLLYRSVGSARQHVAEEILVLAKHNSAFERCCSRPRNGQKAQYHLDAAFRLIRETEQSLDTLERLLLSSVVEDSWTSWDSTTDSRPLPCHFLVSHPTTRALLSSLAAHVQAFATFFSLVKAPLAPPSGTLGAVLPGPSHVVTDLAKSLLADVQQKAAVGDGSKLCQALDRIEGILSAKATPTPVANSALLRLELAPDASVDPQALSRALASLPATAFDQAALFGLGAA